jgi:surfactin synthase thioesterase subunit
MAAFIEYPPNPKALVRLICLPYAGGGAARYYTWTRLLGPDIQVLPVQLPGREVRYREASYTHLDELIGALLPAISPYLDRPYAIFGYSMGAFIGFELIRAIRRQGWRQPGQFFLAASRAPQLEPPRPFIHQLSDTEIVEQIGRRYGQIPPAVLAEKELLDMYVRAIKADFTMIETYTYVDDAPLALPFIALGGEQDTMVTRAGLAGWQAHTSEDFRLVMLPGGHFFINEQQPALLRLVRQVLEQAGIIPIRSAV